ncbi:hypothetical protein GE09DRAFT_28117 [Coniochaeta sp. 2T2.1]|nr:hypothetical protein GE09DRAFT_28117 [Coniochaeta sp. 2T2.1]
MLDRGFALLVIVCTSVHGFESRCSSAFCSLLPASCDSLRLRRLLLLGPVPANIVQGAILFESMKARGLSSWRNVSVQQAILQHLKLCSTGIKQSSSTLCSCRTVTCCSPICPRTVRSRASWSAASGGICLVRRTRDISLQTWTCRS